MGRGSRRPQPRGEGVNVADLPQGFYVGDLYVFPAGMPSDGNFGYIPGAPSVETGDSNAKATLLSSPAGAVLSVQAVWKADSTEVDTARNAIPNQYPEGDLDAGSINLSPAQLDDSTASLTVVDT